MGRNTFCNDLNWKMVISDRFLGAERPP
jgi:hypothetical protein